MADILRLDGRVLFLSEDPALIAVRVMQEEFGTPGTI
jgi:hypothetical protein